jgi:diguanylate cyclase (GGDEF)-like protein/PAS domain S-box-containing protein
MTANAAMPEQFAPTRLFVMLLVLIFCIEGAMMFALDDLLPKGTPVWVGATIDAGLLTAITSVFVWWLFLRPLRFALLSEELKFREMAENIRDVFFLVDADGPRMLYISPAYEEISGRNCESLCANPESWTEAIHPDDHASTYEKYKKGMSVGNAEFEFRIVRPDGSIRWINVRGFPVRDDAGKLVRIAGVAEDITERKQAVRELRESRQRLDGIVTSAMDAIVTVDEEKRIVLSNPAAEEMFGYTAAELQGQSLDLLIPERFRAEHSAQVAAFGETGVTARRKGALRPVSGMRKNGEEFPIEASISKDESTGRRFFTTILRDITERKRLELEKEQYLKFFILSTNPMCIADPYGCFKQVNPAFVQLTGYSESDLIAKPFLDFVLPEDRQRTVDEMKLQVETRPSLYFENHYMCNDGAVIHLSWTAYFDRHERITYATADDITERRRAEQALHESERRFSDLLGNVEMVSLMLDREARITYCNEYLLRLTGWRHKEVIGRNWFELFVPPEINDLKDSFFAGLLANLPEAWHHENEILTRSGERRLIRWNNSVLRSGAGDVIGTASIGEDITEQKRAEIRIKRLNRVYAVLSGIDTLIVHVRVRDELFKEACRIAVEHGQFKMAWIGIVDRSAMKIVPIASAGAEPEFLALIKDRFSLREDAPLGNTMSARAVREKKAIVSNDIRDDPRVSFVKERIERELYSMAILPLLVSDDAVGILALYADEPGFFDEAEMKLLTQLAGDIAFAIDHIDKQERLDYLAYYDVLTGLANRTLFLERVAQYMRSAVSGGHKLAVFLTDLERFKNINDSLGQPAGDALLRQVAEWLTRNAGDANLLARVGADHFAVVLPEVKQGGDVARLLEKWMEAFLDHPFRLNDAVFRIAAKVGVALFPDDGADADTLFRNAEAALKKAKASGDRYLFHTQKMTATVAGKLTLENQLRQALDKEEFVLHYQPKVNLASGQLTGAEALIRWNDPRTGLVPPGRFIPILEETGLIYEVGRWALRQAIADYLRWRAAGLAAVRIAVNVSPLQLRNPGFIAEIRQAIGIDAQAAAGLELEITESLIMEDVKHSIASLQAIRAMGVSIAIDDFGTGFSSLSYLSKLPVDTLKIDRSFVIDMTAAPEGLALVSTIINLAHSLKLNVVAEGVETEEQSRLLRLLSCDEMQGFLFSKPVPSEIFETRYLAPPPAG